MSKSSRRILSAFPAPKPSLTTPSHPVSATPSVLVPSGTNSHSPRLRTRLKPARRLFSTAATKMHSLSVNNINPNVKRAEYAVRGELAVRAEKYRQQLARQSGEDQASGEGQLPFDSVISANIGNPQQLDQKPITFFRQVLSILENPHLLEKEDVLIEHLGYGKDVVERARKLLDAAKSVGAYSQSQGILEVRESVAKFISERDGHPAYANDIYLTAGASAGVGTLMNVICASPETGVLVPIPQYPLYTATLALLNAHCVPYYLDESTNWSTDLSSIRNALEDARKSGIDVRALVVINPGNPTGGCLPAEEIKAALTFAAQEGLVVLADEVYQTNIFPGGPGFTSFKKCLRELQAYAATGAMNGTTPDYNNLELASLHSCSKGMVGECGHRGGYMELVQFDDKVIEQIYKYVSISLCPPVIGQCLVELMVNPPRPGEPSHDLYSTEYNAIYEGLLSRANALYDAFKDMDGVSCQKPEASMYLFPTIKLPERAIDAAQKDGKNPDEFYVSKLLDATGICMVPGKGFGQKEGTYHIRTTFLPPGTEWVGRIKHFHEGFMKQYAS